MIENITGQRPRKRGRGYLDEHEEAQALAKLTRPEARALFRFICATGFRVSEALTVRVEDVERGSTTIIGKRGRVRTIYYSPELVEEMRFYVIERRVRRDQDPARLFPFSRYTANRLLAPANIYPHLLRHTYLTRLYRRTKDLKLTMAVGGHTDPRSALVYQHFTEQEIRAAMTQPRTVRDRVRRLVRPAFRRVAAVAPERKFIPSAAHRRFLVYGPKGVGKSHMIRNSWEQCHRIEWDTKGQTTKALNEIKKEWEGEKDKSTNVPAPDRAICIDFGTPTQTKMKYAEAIELPAGAVLVAEFRTRTERDERDLLRALFEFQPLRTDEMTPPEARAYLKHLCSISNAQYSKVRELLDVSTNPLFLRENLHRKRSEIQMSAVPVTFGWLFVLLALCFMVGRYWHMGRESYAIVTALYFVIRLLRRW